jgi:hypothetical protein
MSSSQFHVLYFFIFVIIFQGISSSTLLLKNSTEEAPVSSPLVPISSFGSSKAEEQNQKAITKAEKVQAVLKKIKQVREAFSLHAFDGLLLVFLYV